MKEILTPNEKRLIAEGFSYNSHGELAMPTASGPLFKGFIEVWDEQHPLPSHLEKGYSENEWWVRKP